MSHPVQLPGFLATLAPLLDHWGYLAVGFLIFVEDFGVPAPGETVLIAASVYAGAGRLNIVAVGVVGFAAAVLGDNTGYAIGRFGGRTLVLRGWSTPSPGPGRRRPGARTGGTRCATSPARSAA